MSGIRIRGLTKNYGAMRVVHGIDLDIARGDFVTLLGPSGSGKTTTLRMIAGLEKPDGGSIEVGGRTLFGPGANIPTYQRDMGMVFQSYAVWPHKSVFDNVAFPLLMRKIPRSEQEQRVEKMLDLVELPSKEFGRRYPSQLSGGQQQRVSLARALISEPQVILFDEPLSNLDARLRDSMRTLLRSIHDRIGITSIYVTHDQIEAMVLSDKICVMREGRIVQEENPRTIYENPANAFVAEFVGQANMLPVTDIDVTTSLVHLDCGFSIQLDAGRWTGREKNPTHLLIRYHRIKLRSPNSESRKNSFLGTVRETSYLGDRVRYNIELAVGTQIIVEIPAEQNLALSDSTVEIEFPADGCVLV